MIGSGLVTAVRGPVVLTTLGLLLVWDHFEDVSFWTTWPVLIIVFGVMKLFERMWGSDPAGPGGPP